MPTTTQHLHVLSALAELSTVEIPDTTASRAWHLSPKFGVPALDSGGRSHSALTGVRVAILPDTFRSVNFPAHDACSRGNATAQDSRLDQPELITEQRAQVKSPAGDLRTSAAE